MTGSPDGDPDAAAPGVERSELGLLARRAVPVVHEQHASHHEQGVAAVVQVHAVLGAESAREEAARAGEIENEPRRYADGFTARGVGRSKPVTPPRATVLPGTCTACPSRIRKSPAPRTRVGSSFVYNVI